MDPVAVLAVVACVALYLALRGDLNPINGYLGDDGADYVRFVQNFPSYITNKTPTSYGITRVLPIWAVYTLTQKVDWPLDAPELVRLFQIFNGALCAVALLAFLAALRRLRVSTAGRVLGLLLALGSYAVSKSPYFYPAMIDTFAMTVGAVYAYFYVRRSRLGLFGALVVGAFSWPYLLLILGAILFAFLPRRPPIFVEGHLPAPAPERATVVSWAGAAVAAAVLAFLLAHALRVRGVGDWGPPVEIAGDPFRRYHHYDPVLVRGLLPVAVAVTMATGVLPFFSLLRGFTVRDVIAEIRVEWLAVPIVVGVVAQRTMAEWSQVKSFTEPALDKLFIQYGLTIQRPAQALVGHFAYFGVATVFLLVHWRRFASVVRRLGLGYVLVCLAGTVLLLSSESRQEVPLLFLFLVPLTKALDEHGVGLEHAIFTALVGFGTSSVWMDLRHIAPQSFATGEFLEFPLQWYFMRHGITMNHRNFVIWAAAFTLATAAAVLVARKRPRDA